jgi:hypothetical protein
VHAAEGSFEPVERYTTLYEIAVESAVFEFPPAPSACKESAVIGFTLDVNLEYSRYLSFMENHTGSPVESFVASIRH